MAALRDLDSDEERLVLGIRVKRYGVFDAALGFMLMPFYIVVGVVVVAIPAALISAVVSGVILVPFVFALSGIVWLADLVNQVVLGHYGG